MNCLEPYRADLIRLENNPSASPQLVATKRRQLKNLEKAIDAFRNRADNAAFEQAKKYRRYIERLEGDADVLEMHNTKLLEMLVSCFKIMAVFEIDMHRVQSAMINPKICDALVAVKAERLDDMGHFHIYQRKKWSDADANLDMATPALTEKDQAALPHLKEHIAASVCEARRIRTVFADRSAEIMINLFSKFPTLKNLITNAGTEN